MKKMLSKWFLQYIEWRGWNCIGDYSYAPNDLARLAAAFPKRAAHKYRDRYDAFLENEDPSVLSIYFQKFCGGTSLMNLKYLSQLVNKKSLQPYSYDYGEEENLKMYGSKIPPRINYNNIRCKLALFFGKHDIICTPSDGEKLISQLPQEKIIFSKLDYNVDHAGFAVSPNMEHMDKILEIFEKNENIAKA